MTVGGVAPDHLTEVIPDLGPVFTNLHNPRAHRHGHHACNTSFRNVESEKCFLRWLNCLCLPLIWATLQWPQGILHLWICFSDCGVNITMTQLTDTLFTHTEPLWMNAFYSAFFYSDKGFLCFKSWLLLVNHLWVSELHETSSSSKRVVCVNTKIKHTYKILGPRHWGAVLAYGSIRPSLHYCLAREQHHRHYMITD